MQTSRLYHNRLDKIERLIKPSSERQAEETFAFQRVLESAMNTMSQEHRQEFAEALEIWADVYVRQTRPHDTPMPRACKLLDALIDSHFLSKSDEALTFGPDVFNAVCDGLPYTAIAR